MQAEPDETVMSFMAIIRLSPSMNAKLTLRVVRGAVLHAAVEVDLGNVVADAVPEAVAKARKTRHLRLHLLLGKTIGLAHADDLVGSRVPERMPRSSAAVRESGIRCAPGACGARRGRRRPSGRSSAGGEAHRGSSLRAVDVEVDLAGGLRGVAVEDDAVLVADRRSSRGPE